MTASPLVSVVASAYNAGRDLERSLRSVLDQRDLDLELVVVDDGSTDGTAAILARLSADDARVRVVRQENAGLTRALIRGCAEARGQLVARHDTDDLSLPGRIAKQAESLLADPCLAMVSCGARAIGPEDETLWEVCPPPGAEDATDRLVHRFQGPSAHGTVMFRRSAYVAAGGYRSQFYFAQDVDLWLRLAEIGALDFRPEILYAFRVSEASISTRHRDAQVALGLLAHECRKARAAGAPEQPILVRAAGIRRSNTPAWKTPAAGAYFIGRCLLKRRDPRARTYLWRALRRAPWHVKALASIAQSYAPMGPRG